MSPLPVNEFILKIASRCNLDCDYCYEYNLGDDSWRRQPKFMSLEIAAKAVDRILEHRRVHGLTDTIIVSLHGGEPMLAGAVRVDAIAKLIRERLEPHAPIELTMQSNATLVDPPMIAALRDNRIAVGVSIDGPSRVNDLHRLDHSHRSSFDATYSGILALRDAGVLSGLLSVIDVVSDPLEVFDFLGTLEVPQVDFLLPHHNWTRPPARPGGDPSAYGKWYAAIWGAWLGGRHSWMRIRYFEQIIRTLVGAQGLFEGLGLAAVQLLVVATDGSLEGVDTLKSCGDGQQKLHLSIIDSPIDAVLQKNAYAIRQAGVDQLCEQCLACPYREVCGGGYFPHRYYGGGSFLAPSVYCEDIQYLIERISSDITTRSIKAEQEG
jgi:uncharacterized protein